MAQEKEVLQVTQQVLDHAETTNLITTSNDLLLKAQWPRLTIGEQRLVLYMLAMVNKWDEDFKTYRISVRELGNIMESKNKNLYQEFDKATDGLMVKIIKWIDPNFAENGLLRKVTWCSYAGLAQGKGFVELAFDPRLKPFLLALKGNFTQYELRAVIKLKNHYALRIYQLLKYNQGMSRRDGRTSAVVTLTWLREYLGLDGYEHFSHFKTRVLVPAKKDIQEKTDLKFDYKLIKKIRKFEEIEFFWSRNPKYDQLELPIPIEKQEEFTEYEEKTFKRLLEFGIEDKTARKIMQNGEMTLENINHILDNITKKYLNPGKKQKPIEDLTGFLAVCFRLPPGTITKKPKIQVDKERQIEEAGIKAENEAREREEFEKIDLLRRDFGNKHREAMETRVKEIIAQRGLKWPVIIDEYQKQAPSYVLKHLEKVTVPGGLRRIPYTKDQALKKDPMIKEDFFRYLKSEFLYEEEIDLQVFVKNNAPEKEYELLKSLLWEKEE